MLRARSMTFCALMALALASAGCTYLGDRGRDAADFLDFGVTVSKEPQFSLYAGFLSVVPLGYSNVDGTMYGLSDRQFGGAAMRHNARGILLWGEEQLGYRDFDPLGPQSPEPWRVGVLGLSQGPGPRNGQVVNCPKLLHLGWAGVALNCKFGELVDFLLGWFTVDIMGDDLVAAQTG